MKKKIVQCHLLIMCIFLIACTSNPNPSDKEEMIYANKIVPEVESVDPPTHTVFKMPTKIPSKPIPPAHELTPNEVSTEKSISVIQSPTEHPIDIPPVKRKSEQKPQKKKKKPVTQPATKNDPDKLSEIKKLKQKAPETTTPIEKNYPKKVTPELVPSKPNSLEIDIVEKELETQIAMLEELKKPQQKILPLELNWDSFPMKFGNTWQLDRFFNKSTGQDQCIIKSKSITLDDGYTDTAVSLTFVASKLTVIATSNIDLTYPGVGMYVDDMTKFPIDHLENESSAAINMSINKFANVFSEKKQVIIKLGFWPTWPKTETRTISFNLANFKQAYNAFKTCVAL